MGFLDTVKGTASSLAADAGRAGKVANAQVKLVSLQGDVRKAERDLGRAALRLADAGELDAELLAEELARLRAADEAMHAKEAEIAAIRAAGEDAAADDESNVEGDAAPAEAGEAAEAALAAAAQQRAAARDAAAMPAAAKSAAKPKTRATTAKPASKAASPRSGAAAAKPATKKAPAAKPAGKAKSSGAARGATSKKTPPA